MSTHDTPSCIHESTHVSPHFPDVIIFCCAGPVWLKNLYFAYLLVLRAIVKAEPYWKQYQFYTGSKVDDHITRIRVTKLTRAAQ